MRKFWLQAGAWALVAGLALMGAGCTQIGVLKGQLALRDAVKAYQRQDYRVAAQKYEEAIKANPELGDAYFYLGNSYGNLYRPARKGDPNNDQLLDKAIANYKIASEKAETPITKQRALQFLVDAYGPEKMNDASQQEPLLRKMIEMDPSDPGNYFYLSNVYEQNGDYEEAEKLLLQARDVKPKAPEVYNALALFYNRQGQFDKLMAALQTRAQQDPNNPEVYYTIATYYWEKAYKDFTITAADKIKYIKLGLESVDKAIQLKPDYAEAFTYKGLLLRAQALVEKDPKVQQQLINDAKTYGDRATEIRNKQRASGAE